MIRLTLRLTPGRGPSTLAWLAGAIAALDEVHAFLLRAVLVARVGAGAEPDDPRTAAVVAGRLAEAGSPAIRLAEVPGVLELGTPITAGAAPVHVLAMLADLLEAGPHGAGWPEPVRSAWHATTAEAEAARHAYAVLHDSCVVQVWAGELGSESPPRLRKEKRRRGTDLPTGVRRATDLDG